MNADTLESVQNRISEIGSQSALARHLGVSQQSLSDIINGRSAHVSLRTENKVRVALGLSAVVLLTVPACPDCGSVHTGRCNGRPVALRPVRQPKPASRWADVPTSMLAAAIRNRTEM